MKKLLVVFAILLNFTLAVQAQPDNDECSGAIALLIDYESDYHPVNVSMSTASTFNESTNYETNYDLELYFTGRDVWYIVNSGSHTIIRTTLDLYTTCGNRLESTDHDYMVVPHQNYIIAVREHVRNVWGIETYLSSNSIWMQFINTPLHNNCGNSLSMTLPNIGEQLVVDDTDYTQRVFYSTIPVSDLVVKAKVDFSATCGASDALSSLSNSYYFTKLESGVEYYFDFLPDAPFLIEALAFPQANSTCSAPLNISVGEVAYHIPSLTNDEGLGPQQGNGLPVSYYSITAPASGAISVKSASSIDLYLYNDGCSGGAPLQQSVLRGTNTKVYTNLTSGTNYTLAVVHDNSARIEIGEFEIASNNDCDQPITILANGTDVVIDLQENGARSIESTYIDNTNTGNDKWYLVNNTERLLDFTLSNSSSLKYQIYNVGGDCTMASEYGNIITSSGVYDTPESNFLIRVFSSVQAPEPTSGTLRMDVSGSNASLAINDECLGAIELSLNHTYELGDMLDASISSESTCNELFSARDLWYKYTPSLNESIAFQNGEVQFYQGSCATLELIDCIANNQRTTLLANITYYFRVSYSGESVDFRISSASSEMMGCPEAEVLRQDRTNHIARSTLGYRLENPNSTCSGFDRFTENLFSIASSSIPRSIEVDGGSYQTNKSILTLYSGTCGNLIEIECVEDEIALFSLLPNTDYTLMWSRSHSSNVLEYNFYGPIPAEDECAGAVPLNVSTVIQELNFDYEKLTNNIEGSTCFDDEVEDFWLSFIAPASGRIVMSGGTRFEDYSFALYDNCLSPNSISCNSGRGEFEFEYSNLISGETYYIRSNMVGILNYIALALPQNNIDCDSAIIFTSDNCNSTISGQSYDRPDGVWYRFSMPISGSAKVNNLSSNEYELFVGDCSSLNSLDLVDRTFFVTNPGDDVYIRIKKDIVFDFCIESLDPPNYLNVSCSNATDISVSTLGSCTMFPFDINPVSVSSNFESRSTVSLWYSFIANSNKMKVEISDLSTSNLQYYSISIFDGCDGVGRLILDSELLLENLVIGEEVIIKLEASVSLSNSSCLDDYYSCTSIDVICDETYEQCLIEYSEESTFSGNICITGLLPPAANDDCINSETIQLSNESCNNKLTGNTNNAYDTKFNCAVRTRELFYIYSATDDIHHNIKLENSTTPMYISIFEGSCNGIEIACGVDKVLFTSNAASIYIIAVSPYFDDQNSSFDICIQELVLDVDADNVGIDIEKPVQKLHVDGAIVLGSTVQPFPGTIRYTGQDFEGFTNNGWTSMTQNESILNSQQTLSYIGDDLGGHIATEDLNMDGNNITDVAAPNNFNDAVNKFYVDNIVANLEDQISNLDAVGSNISSTNSTTGTADNLGNHRAIQTLNLSNNRISNLASPQVNTDGATKAYVDEAIDQLSEEMNNLDNNAPFNQSNGNVINSNNGGFNFGSAEGDNLGDHQAEQSLDMNDNLIEGLVDPITLDHATNKNYVDGQIDNLQNQIELIESSIGNVSGADIDNIYLDSYYDNGRKFFLKVDAGDTDHTVNLGDLFNGWYYENNGENEEVYTEGIDVIINDKLELSRFSLTRFSTNSGNVMDITSNSNNLVFDLHNVSQNQSYPLLQIGSYLEGGGDPSFNFDPDKALLGIGTITPLANIHISKTSNRDFVKLEHSGIIRSVFDTDGKLGIGITDPQEEIDVDGSIQVSTNSDGSNFQLNLIENNSGYARLNMTNTSGKDITLAAAPNAVAENSKLNFFIEDAGDVMTITGAKRVGVNNAAPESDLHIIHKNGPANGGLRLQNENDVANDYWNMYVSSSSDQLRLYANNTQVGQFNFTTGAYSTVSDGRMKSNIKPLHFNWSNFMLLNASNYIFNNDPAKRKYLGLIAQDVNEIYPELVQFDEEEDTYRLDYTGTGVIAIKAVQELKKENEELKAKLEIITKSLENENALLLQRLVNLEKIVHSLAKE